MNLKIKGIFILAVLLMSAGAGAEETVLTIDKAVQYASENNINIQQSKITLNALKRTKNFSWNSVSPSATVNGNFSFPDEKLNYAYTHSESVQGTIRVSLSPSLYSSMETAYLNYENGKITYDKAVRSIEQSVRKAFYGLLYEQDHIALLNRNLETAEQQYKQNTSKYQSGQVSELDMLTSQVSYEKLKPALESAQVTFVNELASFKHVLGIDQAETVTLSGSLDDVLALQRITIDTDITGTPSVVSAENNVKIAKAALLAKRFSAYGPVVSASMTYGKAKTDVSDDFSTSSASSFSLGVSIPLDGYLPWSSSGLSIASSKDSLKTARLQLEDEKTTVAVSVNNYQNKIRQGQLQIESLKANIELAQKTYDMTLIAYNHGSKDLLSLQSAADSLMSAKVSLASQEYTLISAVLDLEGILGVPFGTLGK
jgi:outer membrane protein